MVLSHQELFTFRLSVACFRISLTLGSHIGRHKREIHICVDSVHLAQSYAQVTKFYLSQPNNTGPNFIGKIIGSRRPMLARNGTCTGAMKALERGRLV